MGPEVEGGVIQRLGRLDQCRALAQSQGELVAERRQDAHLDVAVGTGDEGVFAVCLDGRGRLILCHPTLVGCPSVEATNSFDLSRALSTARLTKLYNIELA
jgi:hypothetical protein